jgi:glyoxylate/hydroxypyruvate reductase A
MTTVLVVATGWDAQDWADRIAALLPGHRVLSAERDGSYSGPASDLTEVRYLLAWRPPQPLLDSLPNLAAIFSLGAGVDHLMSLRLPDVPVARIVDPDLTSRMAEYVVWQVLHHHRLGPAYVRQQKAHIWRELDQPAAAEITVGILGFGHLGERAAAALAPLGFRLRGWTRTARTHSVELFHGADGLQPFLAGTDILVSLLPLTPETRGLVDRRVLGALRRTGPLGGAIYINAGRGGTQVEADIVAALADGTLAGASIDVVSSEPLAPDSPLWDFDNVVVTPHAAASSEAHALAAQIAAQIAAHERGETLVNLVERRRGY